MLSPPQPFFSLLISCLQENSNFEADSQTPVLSHNWWATTEHDKMFHFLQQSQNFQKTLDENTSSLQDVPQGLSLLLAQHSPELLAFSL